MCDGLDQLREAVVAYGQAFDPALLSVADAEAVVQHAAVIERVASTVKALTVARVARRGTNGGVQPTKHDAQLVASATGTSLGAARQALDLGRRLQEQPALAARARTGEVSGEQAGLLAEAGEADPGAVSRLVAQTHAGMSVGELRQEVARIKAAACPDLEARRQHIHARRRLRT